jgi:aspartyl/asparaginyl beta-hydroxylase (cupin superfamily)
MFQTLELYPELLEIKNHFKEIKDEVFSLNDKMFSIQDYRVNTNVWNVFPLLPEEEDRAIVSDEVWKKNQLLAPLTTSILSSISCLEAYSFSSLKPSGHIRPHKHENPYITASLCIQDGGDSYMVVNGIKSTFKTEEILIFDYTQEHEVFNNGTQDRIVLLMLLKNRCI